MHQDNCFITLTYSDKNLPHGGTLNKKHFQDFMKRLRRGLKEKISYFHCGEYGDIGRRPHYHALLFGHDFSDKVAYKKTASGEILYTSAQLERTWGWGFTTVGSLTFESAAYCARYVMKKITGAAATRHYEKIEPSTGEVVRLLPEYITMSLKSPIGKGWYEQFHADAYPCDNVVIRGKVMRPPRYYDKLLAAEQPVRHFIVKEGRRLEGEKHFDDNSNARLRVRETVKLAQTKLLKRGLDE